MSTFLNVHRKAATWSRVIEDLREAEDAGDFALAEKLDREQIKLLKDKNDFPDFILKE